MKSSFLKPYFILQQERKTALDALKGPAATAVKARVNPRSFIPRDLAQLYNFPQPVSNERLNIVVVSFGGGLFGTVDPSTGIVTGGDLQPYWTQVGLTSFPTVTLQLLGDAQNLPDGQDGATIENHIDVEMIGAIFPNSNITLIIAPNTDTAFTDVFQAARAVPGVFAVSCSWGFPESEAPPSFLNSINAILQDFATHGINVCCAAGDNGSSDGISGANADFPGSSPFVVCCGGTTLLSATDNYDAKTQETVWNDNSTSSATGGGHSTVFTKPAYQQAITLSNFRMVPDVALCADPNTGVIFRVDSTQFPVGGTSIVAPLMTGYLALIRCNTFLNPMLYASPNTCFHDIVTGNNGAYRSGKGFDMASGLGSFNGILLQNAMRTNFVQITPSNLTFTNTNPQQLSLRAVGSQTIPPSQVWTSSNTKIATVNNTGLVTPVSDGTCNITCSAASGSTVTITVRGVSVLATSITLLPAVAIGQTMKIALSSKVPANASASSVTWVSSQPRIATVDAVSGIVRGVGVGVVNIVGTLQDGNHAQATVTVQVTAT